MSPRYNPGDELFLRPFFGVPGTAIDKPDIAIATDDGRIHIGQFIHHDATGVTISLLFQQKTAFIAHNRNPILYAITGAKRQKPRANDTCRRVTERLFAK